MPNYPAPLERRFAQALKALQDRMRKLEARTAGIDSGFPLMALPAQIDPGYTSGDPMVLLNGSTVLTGPYQHLASYTPVAGDQVIALPIVASRTYIILGKTA